MRKELLVRALSWLIGSLVCRILLGLGIRRFAGGSILFQTRVWDTISGNLPRSRVMYEYWLNIWCAVLSNVLAPYPPLVYSAQLERHFATYEASPQARSFSSLVLLSLSLSVGHSTMLHYMSQYILSRIRWQGISTARHRTAGTEETDILEHTGVGESWVIGFEWILLWQSSVLMVQFDTSCSENVSTQRNRDWHPRPFQHVLRNNSKPICAHISNQVLLWPRTVIPRVLRHSGSG